MYLSVGPATIEIVLSEIGDIERFRSNKRVVAYAGLAPGHRESAGHKKDLGITKEGSGLLRWALIQTAWRMLRCSVRWRYVYENLQEASRFQAGDCGRGQAAADGDGRLVAHGATLPP